MSTRDRQRRKLYDWEQAAADRREFAVREVSLQEIEDLGSRIWREHRFKGPAPRVKDGRGRRRAGGSYSTVTFPIWSRKLWIALHEYAHSITIQEYGWSTESHGPTFARIYIDLLVRYAGGDLPTLLGSARGARLRVVEHDLLSRYKRSAI